MAWWNFRNPIMEIAGPEYVAKTALEAGLRARQIAESAHLPNTEVETAEASAIGAVVARQYTGGIMK